MRAIVITFFVLSVFLPCGINAQATAPVFTTERDSAYTTTFNTLKELFIKQMLTERYQQTRLLVLSYKSKLKSSGHFKAASLANDPGGLKWLKENWTKTGFTSYEEAVREYRGLEASFAANNRESKEHMEFDSFNFDAMLKYGPHIYVDMYKEVMLEYPDKI